MIKTFYSLDGVTKRDINFTKVNLVETKDILATLGEITDGKIFYAKKGVSVYVSPAVLGDMIDTRKRFSLYGKVLLFDKDKQIVEERDVQTNSKVIFYTDGQVELIRGEKFDECYKLENKEWELYKPLDTVKKYLTVTQNIYFQTSYGDIIYAPIGSKLCIENLEQRDFFVVTNSFFKVAYQEIETSDKYNGITTI